MQIKLKPLAGAVLMALGQQAFAGLTNGDFESGLTGWTVTVNGRANPAAVASGTTTTSAGTIEPSLTGDHYVYTSQTGGGSSFLSQAFTVQSGVNKIFFDVAINNRAGAFYTPNSLDYSGAQNQQARFDILKPGALITTTNAGDIIATGFQTLPGSATRQNWQRYSIDVTSQLAPYAGQNVIFRFVQVDNQHFFNLAIDNVNVGAFLFQPPVSAVSSSTAMSNTPAMAAAGVIDANPSLLNHFSSLSGDDRAVSRAVSQTMPLLTGSSQFASQSALSGINRVIQARLDGNPGLSSGDVFYGNKSFWMKPFGSWANQDSKNNVAGYKANVYGAVFGFDAPVSHALRVGGAFAYAKSDIDSKSSDAPQSAKIDVYQLIGYGSYSLDERTDINFQADIGQNKNKGRRQISFMSSTATSDYDSQSAHIGLGIGRTYPLTEKTSLIPSARIDYTWLKDESYTEKGADVFNLSVGSRSVEALVVGFDGKLLHRYNDATSISANVGVGYDTINKSASILSAYAGAPEAVFVTRGIRPDPWLVKGGLGLTQVLKSGLELTGRYDAEYRERFLNQTASVKLRWSF